MRARIRVAVRPRPRVRVEGAELAPVTAPVTAVNTRGRAGHKDAPAGPAGSPKGKVRDQTWPFLRLDVPRVGLVTGPGPFCPPVSDASAPCKPPPPPCPDKASLRLPPS